MPYSPFSRSGARSRTRFRLLAICGVVAILLLCFLPGDLKLALHTRGRLHSVGHLVVFLCLAYALNRTSRSQDVRWALFVGTLVVAFGTELGEHALFGTEVEWQDIAVDAAGAVVGTVLARFSSRRELR